MVERKIMDAGGTGKKPPPVLTFFSTTASEASFSSGSEQTSSGSSSSSSKFAPPGEKKTELEAAELAENLRQLLACVRESESFDDEDAAQVEIAHCAAAERHGKIRALHARRTQFLTQLLHMKEQLQNRLNVLKRFEKRVAFDRCNGWLATYFLKKHETLTAMKDELEEYIAGGPKSRSQSEPTSAGL